MTFECKPLEKDLLAGTWPHEPYTDDEIARLRAAGMDWALAPDILAEDGRWANFRALARQDLARAEAPR